MLNMNILTSRSIFVISACLALVACSGAPSESQMKEAFLAQAKQEREAVERFGGQKLAGLVSTLTPEFKGVRKIGCKDDGEKAYRCDVEIELVQAGTVAKKPVSLRFVKGSDGWLVSN